MSMPRDSSVRDLAWWSGVTLPLPIAALFLYVASEWLFFVTMPSPLSIVPIRESVQALFTTSGWLVGRVLLVQLAATTLALSFPRLRIVAAFPAGMILTLFGLMVADNFTYVVLGFSSIYSAPFARYVYGALILVTVVACTRSLAAALTRYGETGRRSALIVIWCIALPPIIAAIVRDTSQNETERRPIARPSAQAASLPSSQGASAGTRRPNILFLASDGMSATRMSVYGYKYPTTPFLESIRDETLFCENAFTNAGLSYGSIVTLLTGKLPMTHKAFAPPAVLHRDIARQHLPGMLRERGYRTIQLSVRFYADAVDANLVGAFDLANYRRGRVLVSGETIDWQGSPADRWRDDLIERLETRLLHMLDGREVPDAYRAVTAKQTVNDRFWSDERRVRTLLDFVDAEPWFAHVHLNDTHDGVRPPEEYDAAIRAADASFRTIYEALKAKGQLNRTVIVISSDHGRKWSTVDRVPLMIRFPDTTNARMENRNVQLADVAPTILDYLEQPLPRWMDGDSLLRQERLRHDRPIFGIAATTPQGPTGRFTLSQLGPPNYGGTKATVISDGQWLHLEFDTGKTSVGDVEGHTAAGVSPRSSSDARELLVKKLELTGFRLGSSPSVAEGAGSAVTSAEARVH